MKLDPPRPPTSGVSTSKANVAHSPVFGFFVCFAVGFGHLPANDVYMTRKRGVGQPIQEVRVSPAGFNSKPETHSVLHTDTHMNRVKPCLQLSAFLVYPRVEPAQKGTPLDLF